MKRTQEELRNKMIEMTHEERTLAMQLSLYWVCAVIDECKMNTKETSVSELLDVLFDLKGHQEED